MIHYSAFNMLIVLLHFPPLKSGVVESDGDPLAEFLRKEIVMASTQPIMFNRSKKPFAEIRCIYKNQRLQLKRDHVSEMGDDEYEEAADVGGPKKEFFNVVAEALLYSTSLF